MAHCQISQETIIILFFYFLCWLISHFLISLEGLTLLFLSFCFLKTVFLKVSLFIYLSASFSHISALLLNFLIYSISLWLVGWFVLFWQLFFFFGFVGFFLRWFFCLFFLLFGSPHPPAYLASTSCDISLILSSFQSVL